MDIAELVTGEVVGRDELLRIGFTAGEVRVAVRREQLLPLHRGVYALRSELPAPTNVINRLRVQGVAQRSPTMVVSHVSAALMHGLPTWNLDESVVHLTRSPGGGAVRRAGRIVHSAAIDAHELAPRNGLLLTNVARTLVDLGRSVPFESAVVACDYALHRDLVSPGELLTALEDARGRPGRQAEAMKQNARP
jgi:hypothetical protein